MKRSSNLMLMAFAVVMTACGSNNKNGNSGDPAMDSNGNCSSGVIEKHNSIVSNAKVYAGAKSTPAIESLKSTQKSCKELNTLLDNRSCKALVHGTTEITTVQYSDVAQFCSVVDQAISPSNSLSKSSTTASEQSTSPAVPASSEPLVVIDPNDLTKLSKPIQIKIKDAALVNQHLAAGIGLYLQKGSSVVQSKLEIQNDLCWLEKRDASVEVRDNEQIKMDAAKSESDVLSISSEDQKIQLECLKLSSQAQPWTVQRLQVVFGSAIEVVVSH